MPLEVSSQGEDGSVLLAGFRHIEDGLISKKWG